MYASEQVSLDQNLVGAEKFAYRNAHTESMVEAFFNWAEAGACGDALLPSNPVTKALQYALERRAGLSVYLDDLDVPIDTNHLERVLRPIPVRRKNRLFCWSGVGAEVIATIHSLLVTCRLHDVDPYEYLSDLLQRIDNIPAEDIEQLILRHWKQHFVADPLRSDLLLIDGPEGASQHLRAAPGAARHHTAPTAPTSR